MKTIAVLFQNESSRIPLLRYSYIETKPQNINIILYSQSLFETLTPYDYFCRVLIRYTVPLFRSDLLLGQ